MPKFDRKNELNNYAKATQMAAEGAQRERRGWRSVGSMGTEKVNIRITDVDRDCYSARRAGSRRPPFGFTCTQIPRRVRKKGYEPQHTELMEQGELPRFF